MDYVSYITLLVLVVYFTAVRQCDGHSRHAQRSRTRRDRYQDSYPSSYSSYEEQLLTGINERLNGIISQLNQENQQKPVYVPNYMPYSSYNYNPMKLREEKLLMEINERLSGILSQLNQQKRQQPVYIPIYVPYYMPSYAPTNTQIRTTTKNDEKVDVNERNSFKKDPVLNTKDKRIEPPQDISNTGEKMDCQIAIVACCRFSEDGQKQNCFRFYKCPETNYNNQGCAKETIDNAVSSVVNSYKPSKRHT